MKKSIADWVWFTTYKNTQELLLAAECVLDTIEDLDKVTEIQEHQIRLLRNSLEDVLSLIMDCHDSVFNSYMLLAKHVVDLPQPDEMSEEE